MFATYLFAADFRAIGLSVAAIVFLGFCGVYIWNIVRARPELGSEIELAPNRKEYLSDEELEGEKLDRSLSFALVLLTLLAIVLPFYWLAEPGRQEGAIAAYNLSFESRGEGTYVEGAGCAGCHGSAGGGGSAPYVLQDADGQFVSNAAWKAPALDNVLLRYSEDEVRYILNFGRPGSPMAAWGTVGGGPLTTQQVNNTIIYLRTLQLQSLDPLDITLAGGPTMDDEESMAALEAAQEIEAEIREEVQRSLDDGEYATIGEAVFNLGLQRDFAGGAYSCGRCHTAGWSLGLDVVTDVLDEGVAACGGGNPSGIGFNLCGDSIKDRFPDDTWLLPDGTWYGPENPSGYDGSYLVAMDGSEVALDDSGNPVNAEGKRYLILSGTDEDPDRNGDLADCVFESGLWQPDAGLAYPYDNAIALVKQESNDRAFVDPEQLTIEAVEASTGEAAFFLDNGKIVAGCDIVDMPGRTSQAHYDFIAGGADAGVGYGEGGLSAAGMMPGFAKMLPADLIQAVVDYERGL